MVVSIYGLMRIVSDYSVFVCQSQYGSIGLAVYFGDIVTIRSDKDGITSL